jgi:hypothetical protein
MGVIKMSDVFKQEPLFNGKQLVVLNRALEEKDLVVEVNRSIDEEAPVAFSFALVIRLSDSILADLETLSIPSFALKDRISTKSISYRGIEGRDAKIEYFKRVRDAHLAEFEEGKAAEIELALDEANQKLLNAVNLLNHSAIASLYNAVVHLKGGELDTLMTGKAKRNIAVLEANRVDVQREKRGLENHIAMLDMQIRELDNLVLATKRDEVKFAIVRNLGDVGVGLLESFEADIPDYKM